MSKPYAEVIGDPIAHSKSPLIHNFWLGKLGIDADYRACHVTPGELDEYLQERRKDPEWRGCNVTLPHKQAVLALLDEVRPAAQAIGAVNTIWRDTQTGGLVGTNTDVDGVREALHGLEFDGLKVVVIGAGGAARAVFHHLAQRPATDVTILARDERKAREASEECGLRAAIATFDDVASPLDGAVLAINTTPLGMTGKGPLPDRLLDAVAQLDPGATVFDMVYAPVETALLNRAASLQRPTVGGLTMLVGQARTAFARFYGSVPPSEYDSALFGMLSQ